LVEQEVAPRSLQVLRGSGAALATFRQCPGELARLQLRQGPVQALSQQTLSTHCPEMHSPESEQGCPFCFWPQTSVVAPLRVCGWHWFSGAQSWLPVQFSKHAPLEQRKGKQSTSCGSRQLPSPSQVRGVFSTKPEQTDGPHTVSCGYRVHEPLPSQRPVLLQVLRSVPWHAGSGEPAGMEVQWPFDPVWLHDTQEPLQGMLQHTPRTSPFAPTQKPEAQSAAVLQTAPLALLPQLPATHCCPTAHWALVVHVKAQRLVAGSQVKGGQGSELVSEQLPLPSQATMPVTLSPSQVPGLHSVPSTYRRQAPLPSQVPSSRQVAALVAGQTRGSLGFPPAGMKAQTPSELARLHALQVSVQAEVQQIPSTQNPVWHSASQLQDSAFPLDLLGVPGAQVLGGKAASAAPGMSEVLASFFPSASASPPPSRLGANLVLVQAAASKTAQRARAPRRAGSPHDDFEP
jgi:hypothetical protein